MKLNGTRFALIVLVIAIALADYYLLQSDSPSTNSSQTFSATNQQMLLSAGK